MKTFLDLVRAYAEVTLAACDPACSKWMHRADAARDLTALKRNPELADAILRWVNGDTADCGRCKLTHGPVIHISRQCPEHDPIEDFYW